METDQEVVDSFDEAFGQVHPLDLSLNDIKHFLLEALHQRQEALLDRLMQFADGDNFPHSQDCCITWRNELEMIKTYTARITEKGVCKCWCHWDGSFEDKTHKQC